MVIFHHLASHRRGCMVYREVKKTMAIC